MPWSPENKAKYEAMYVLLIERVNAATPMEAIATEFRCSRDKASRLINKARSWAKKRGIHVSNYMRGPSTRTRDGKARMREDDTMIERDPLPDQEPAAPTPTGWAILVNELWEAFGPDVCSKKLDATKSHIWMWCSGTGIPCARHQELIKRLLAVRYVRELNLDTYDLEDERDSITEQQERVRANMGQSRVRGA